VTQPSPRKGMPPLEREGLALDPMEQFKAWWERAEREVPLAEAVTLATADREGRPDARMVLLKGFGHDGFRFFTNYLSAKGEQLAHTSRAALVFYWRELDRQVRVRGNVTRLAASESDAYFASRPRDSQIGAAASPQSRPIEREELERRFDELSAEYVEPLEVPRPAHWGGYLIAPEEVEFWQGRESRMHDRFRYTREPGGDWRIERLAP
jgi:pyridoxamine 5'-phosphate oxidase